MNLKEIVKSNLCISCGACVYASQGKLHMKKNKRKGIYMPEDVVALSDQEEAKIRTVCPAQGFPIVAMANSIHVNAPFYDYRVGRYISYFAAKSNSSAVLQKASSGGIMTELAIYLLKNNLVQGIIATTFKYEGLEIVPHTKIYTDWQEILKAQGSKYMPVPALTILKDVQEFNGKLAFIGTPCQIASIRLLQNEEPIFKEKIKYTIGNFCGGFKDLKELSRLRSIAKMSNDVISEFQYRGDGQPGYMIFKTQSNKIWRYSYPDYGKLTGYMKYYRCRVCVDAMAELADVSCGDAWLPNFKSAGGNWSVVVVRNQSLAEILLKMNNEGVIEKAEITFEDLILSQKQNLNSKKERYVGRVNFLRKLGFKIPIYDAGWNFENKSSLCFEAKVYFSQILKLKLEEVGLYSVMNKYVRKLLNK
ncbi:MAG TPA: hypothetical protein DFK15_03785 [Butyricimonas sp.]|uniref:Coenzyme F420 hydrogenase/dehydrogenase, beta subunit C-terminal domain n=1 Tax=Butyricimonas TaxID=574697 RepID=UPI000EBC1F1E|nr:MULTISPECIES: Coenzyme F420 hydrogenase/dehydrogenase, beta subunit C-terminal domain [Butyricimonas]HCH88397.1 hypothetical protein [Butyricimonas sp.]